MTIEYSQDGSIVTNGTDLQGAPAVLISGDNVHFTNTGTGNISGSTAGVPTIRVTGLNATIVNAAGGWIRHDSMTEDAIAGGAGDDTVVNSGIIAGNVRLGDGADTFTDRAGYTYSGGVYMGAGDDVFRHEFSSSSGYGYLRAATGGEGYDTLVISAFTPVLDASSVVEFEALEFATGTSYWNLTNFSGFSAITLGAGGHFNFIGSANPGVDLTLSGGSVQVNTGSSFRDITGSNSDESLEVRSGTIRDANLGGGADIFWYHNFPAHNLPAPVVEGVVDGGSGTDLVILSVGGGTTVDMTMATGFEYLNTGTWTSLTSDVRVINANGYSRIDVDNEGRLVIGESYSPDATVALAFPSTLILESTATVGRIGFDWTFTDTIPDGQAALSVSVTNEGTVLGDVRLYTGNDLFDGRLGTVGGNVYGFAGDDHLRGSAQADRMWGGYGNDRLEGHDGHDRLYGESGSDIIDGGAGDDWIEGGDGNDALHLWNGGGVDTVDGGAGNDNLFLIGSLTAADVVNGGAGNDTLILQGDYAGGLTLTANVTNIELISILAGSNTNFGESGTGRYDYVLTTHDANFAGGIQVRVNGSALLEGEDFTFDGSAELDSRFVAYGGRGVDTLTGSRNNDIFFLAEERFATGDTVNGGAGYDGMFLRGNYTIDFNAPGYTGLFTNIENLTLTSATDERYARGGGTEFDYNLVLSNAIVKPGEILTVSGTLLMASETMILDGSAELDGLLYLFGGRSDDTLKGGGQSDILHGNLGADQLTGNGGSDVFRYNAAAESNASSLDHILDFAAGTDKIDLSRIDADTAAAGDQAFGWIGSNAFSGTAGQLRAYQDGTSWFVEGDTNGDSIADLVIQLTVTGGPLSQGDFLP